MSNASHNKKGSKGKTIKDTQMSRIPGANTTGNNNNLTRSSRDTTSEIGSRRKSNYLFDVQNKYGMKEGGASPFNINAYQD